LLRSRASASCFGVVRRRLASESCVDVLLRSRASASCFGVVRRRLASESCVGVLLRNDSTQLRHAVMSRGVWGQTAKYVIDKHPRSCFATHKRSDGIHPLDSRFPVPHNVWRSLRLTYDRCQTIISNVLTNLTTFSRTNVYGHCILDTFSWTNGCGRCS
jgi:hypothetical protein